MLKTHRPPIVTEPDERNEHKIDPLVETLMRTSFIEIIGDTIAKLEAVRISTPANLYHVFSTSWARRLFDTAIVRIEGTPTNFDINVWFRTIVKNQLTSQQNSRDVMTNWVEPLIQAEICMPGFMIILHNIMEMEVISRKKLTEYMKMNAMFEYN